MNPIQMNCDNTLGILGKLCYASSNHFTTCIMFTPRLTKNKVPDPSIREYRLLPYGLYIRIC
jgi:hypothetical protein